MSNFSSEKGKNETYELNNKQESESILNVNFEENYKCEENEDLFVVLQEKNL